MSDSLITNSNQSHREHLARRHPLPPQCLRCGVVFLYQEDLKSHLRSEVQCEVRQMPPVEGICARKLSLLKSKKKNSDDPGEEGRWRDVYRILFPGAPVPSPCKYLRYVRIFDLPDGFLTTKDHEPVLQNEHQPSRSPGSQNLESFQVFSKTHLPGLIESHLATKINEMHKHVEEVLKSSLPDIVRTSISELLKSWQESNPSLSRPINSVPIHRESSERPRQEATDTNVAGGDVTPFYEEPQFQKISELQSTTAGSFEPDSYIQNALEPSDSGYVSFQDYPCFCRKLFGEASESAVHETCSNEAESSAVSNTFTHHEQSDSLGPRAQVLDDHSDSYGVDREGKTRDDTVNFLPRVCGFCLGIL